MCDFPSLSGVCLLRPRQGGSSTLKRANGRTLPPPPGSLQIPIARLLFKKIGVSGGCGSFLLPAVVVVYDNNSVTHCRAVKQANKSINPKRLPRKRGATQQNTEAH